MGVHIAFSFHTAQCWFLTLLFTPVFALLQARKSEQRPELSFKNTQPPIELSHTEHRPRNDT